MTSAGLGPLKPVLAALLLPPMPFLALALAGAGLARRRPRVARAMVVLACVGVWLGCCVAPARWVEQAWLAPPPPLDAAARAALRARAAAGAPIAIVVLGGGVNPDAAEYGGADLASASLLRLRYGVWLGRATGIPVGASGGVGWGPDGAIQAEASRMAEIARDEYGAPLRWVETASRDTHENAIDTRESGSRSRPTKPRRIASASFSGCSSAVRPTCMTGTPCTGSIAGSER